MSRPSLINLAIEYFKRRGYKIEGEANRGGKRSAKKFDLVIRKHGEAYPVWVKDWRRTVGVNIIINADRTSQEAAFSNLIVVAEKFSEHARAYANRRGIKLITKSEMRWEIGAI